MKSPRFLLFFSTVLYWCSCANIVSPTGGLKDTTPPILVKRSLADSALHFLGGNIYFDFDEFVQVKDVANQITITPMLKSNPKVTARKNRVSIHIDDSLLENNTTYWVSMGDAVSDLHEGNIYKDLHFTFSTGSYFDSLQINGRVIDARTGLPDTSVQVMLYPANASDSAFQYEKPMYAQRTQQGDFSLQNLPNKAFRLYALQDANKNLRYDLSSEKIAFVDSFVQAGNGKSMVLYSFVCQEKTDTSTADIKKTFSRKSAEPITPNLRKGSFVLNADTSNINKRSLDIADTLRLIFSSPLSTIDVNRIRLYQGKELDATAQVLLDSTKTKIQISTQWAEDAVYTLQLLKGFIQDSTGWQGAATQCSFRTKRSSDYGWLKIKTKVKPNEILELLRNDKVVARQVLQDTLLSFPLLVPDRYALRILQDDNGNGTWDNGNFLQPRKQPEHVIALPEPITLKANWENRIDLDAALEKKSSNKKKEE